jgi:hypothetical protein
MDTEAKVKTEKFETAAFAHIDSIYSSEYVPRGI